VKYFLIFNDDNTICGYTGDSKNPDDNAIEVTEEIFNSQDRIRLVDGQITLAPPTKIIGPSSGYANTILKYKACIDDPDSNMMAWVAVDADDGGIIASTEDDIVNGVSEVSFIFDEPGPYLVCASSAGRGESSIEVLIK
jgi:ABC-type phosphate transport system ATPase subunit